MTNPNTSITLLRHAWEVLNKARRDRGLKPHSYSYLATIASDSSAIPGEAIAVSKSTVAAIFADTYNAATAPAIRNRLFNCICQWCKDLQIAFPEHKPKRRPATTPTVTIKRCSQQGYVTYRNNTYYLGSRFAGLICTVSPLRDRSQGIRATIAYASRTAYPVDPCNNQLGYEVASK